MRCEFQLLRSVMTKALVILALILFASPLFADGSQSASCDGLVNLHLPETVISSATTSSGGNVCTA